MKMVDLAPIPRLPAARDPHCFTNFPSSRSRPILPQAVFTYGELSLFWWLASCI